ncbi:MAG: hypothetical protein H0U74_10750 [Bradymonadaceae bacterium]|nr:hypothetical protein [Lujinxingiaceae bacterium]
MSIHRLFAVLSTVLLAASCSSSKPVAQPDPVAPVERAARPADPGPIFERFSGRRSADSRPPVRVPADAHFGDQTHFYLATTITEGFGRRCVIQWLDVRGERHARAVTDCEPQLIVRFVGEQAPQDEVVVDLFWTEDGERFGDVVDVHQPVVISVAQGTGSAQAELPLLFQHRIASAMRQLRGEGDDLAFFSFASHRLELERGLDRRTARTPARRGELGDLMATYTGILSVEEALQIDRALFVRAAPASAQTIALSAIEGVPLAEHPWDKMIAELGQEPVVEPLAAFVPDDMLYIHFHDLRTFVRLAAELDQWISPLFQALELKSGSRHIAERYETMLAIQRSGLSEQLGHLAAHGVAITTSDPFLREGSDVSILFHVREAKLLNQALERYERETRKAHPGLVASSVELAGHSVRLLSTPDGAVQQHRLQLGEVLVLSSSARAIERFIGVHEGTRAPLSKSGDFRYMRARYPYDTKAEDGFVFVSDAFVAHTVGPRTKILSARRMEARADLAAVNHAAMLFGWLEGRLPRDVVELTASGLLRAEELVHADGSPIVYTPGQGASSSWGNLARLSPLIERSIERVSPEEQDAYDFFRSRYMNTWQTFIDPIAARINFDKDSGEIGVDARMLPLIDASEYDGLARQVGTRAVTAPRLEGALQWTLAVGDDASLRRELNAMARQMTGRHDLGLDWLGDWVMVGAADRSGVWDLIMSQGLAGSGEARSGSDQLLLQILGRLPIYIGAHIKNPLMLAATLTATRAFIDSSAPGFLRWHDTEPYREVPITSVGPTEQAGLEFGQQALSDLRLHYTAAGGVFLASFDLATLQTMIDAALDGGFSTAKPADPDALMMQTMITLDPKAEQSWIVLTLLAMLETNAVKSHVGASAAWLSLEHGLGGLPQDDSERRRLALHYLGYEPGDIHDGKFSVDEHGLIRHSIYGPGHDHVAAPVPVAEAAVTRALQSMRSVKMHLGFEGEGDDRGLHTVLRWTRKR